MHIKQRSRRLVAEINVVPYIDVMLVLLIVFMVTAPLLVQGVKVDLPEAASEPIAEDDEPIVISIKADGSYYIDIQGTNQQETLTNIVDRVGKILAENPKTPVMVRGDAKVQYGSVVQLMSQLQGAGAPSVGLVTEPPGADQ